MQWEKGRENEKEIDRDQIEETKKKRKWKHGSSKQQKQCIYYMLELNLLSYLNLLFSCNSIFSIIY